MVYERYVEKNGKVYGPYYQSSKKENGKVVTQYMGKVPTRNGSAKKSFRVSVFAIFFVFFIASFFILINKGITGNVILVEINSTNSTETNVTYENNFSHLNISDVDLVLYMPFDVVEDSGNVTYDYSNDSKDGSLNGTTFNSSGGVYGGAYEFDGDDDMINLGDNYDMGGVNFTICMWAKSGSAANGGYVFGKYNSTSDNGIYLRAWSTNQWLFGPKAAVGYMIVNRTVGSWQHLCIIYREGPYYSYFYVDGVEQSNTTDGVALEDNSFNFTLGNRDDLDRDLLGSIDEVMLFNRTLSEDEIQKIYNSTFSRFYPTGEVLFEGLNFSTNDPLSISISDCQTLNGSTLYGKVNDGTYEEFSGCSISDYVPSGNLTSANFTVKFVSGDDSFYSPLILGNFTFDLYVDTTAPTITFESPTPNNASSINSSSVTITANISDDSRGNTSSWINFNNSLVAYWEFDYYNSTGIYDNSSGDNFGVFNGGLGVANISDGVRGNGTSFDGVSDYIDIPDISEVQDINSTVSLWMKPNNISTTQVILGFGSTVDSPMIGFVSGTGIITTVFGAGDARTGSLTPLNVGEWNHLVVVYNSSGVPFIYVNGVEDSYPSISSWLNPGSYIGRREVDSYFNGSLDEILVFNRSLSSSEVLALYDSRANKFNATFSNLTNQTTYNYTLFAIDEAGNFNSTGQYFSVNLNETSSSNETNGTTTPSTGSPGGSSTISSASSYTVNTSSLSLDIGYYTSNPVEISVTNDGTTSLSLDLTQTSLDGRVVFPSSSIDLEPGETKILNIVFLALNDTGTYSGTIYVGTKSISVTMNVREIELLFDSNIVVLNKAYTVRQGEQLKTSIELIPQGDSARLDVTLNYVIEDYDGNVYLTKSESFLIQERTTFERSFDTGVLPQGLYVLKFELVYPNGVAPSSAHFEVIGKLPDSLFGKIVFYLINAILIVLIAIIGLVIRNILKTKS